jgi:hypothetical protein
MLWDEGALETRLLAAFLLGRIPPQEERLLPRITAWTQQIRDPNVRAALLSTSLTRMRKETPDQFLTLVREYLHPERTRSWSNGIQALIPMIADTDFENLPAIFDIVEPIIEEAPSTLQNDLTDLIVALYRASASETIFMLKHVLSNSQNPMTAVTLRRISPNFPPPLQKELRSLLRTTAHTPKPIEEIDDFVDETPVLVQSKAERARKKKMDNSHHLFARSRKQQPERQGASVRRKIPRHGHARFHRRVRRTHGTTQTDPGTQKELDDHRLILRRLDGDGLHLQQSDSSAEVDPARPCPAQRTLRLFPWTLSLFLFPTVIIHGTEDDVVPLEPVREICREVIHQPAIHRRGRWSPPARGVQRIELGRDSRVRYGVWRLA